MEKEYKPENQKVNSPAAESQSPESKTGAMLTPPELNLGGNDRNMPVQMAEDSNSSRAESSGRFDLEEEEKTDTSSLSSEVMEEANTETSSGKKKDEDKWW